MERSKRGRSELASSNRVRRMWGLDLDSWNKIVLGLGVIAGFAAVLVAFSGWVSYNLQKKEALDAKESLERYKQDAGEKIAESNERASKADKEASDANLKAEQIKAKNLGLERIVAPRRIPFEELPIPVMDWIAKNCSDLSSLSPQIALIQAIPDSEPERIAQDIIEVLSLLKWKVTTISEKQSGLFPLYMPYGITIFTPSTEAPFVPNARTVSPSEDIELTKAAKGLTDCLNALLGPGSASTRELLPLYLHSSGNVPYFDPQPASLVISVGANPIGEKVYLLEKTDR
jgi:hypothetical protein